MHNPWHEYWNSGFINNKQLPQERVGRTVFGKSITEENWKKTLTFIRSQITLNPEQIALELCCGNGLISRDFSNYIQKVYAVDFSKTLIGELDSLSLRNVKTICKDVNSIDFHQNKFDIIILYFSIQYFNKQETILLIERCKKWLKNDGVIYIGDIPDEKKIWQFYKDKKYKENYFDALKKGQAIIGSWYSTKFFKFLGEYLKFSNTKIIKQKDFMINHHYRFDVLMTK